MKVENIDKNEVELQIENDFVFYESLIVLDFKTIAKVKKTVKIQLTLEEGDEKVVHFAVSCGCTTPKIFNVDENTQVIELGFNPITKGDFSKQVTLYNEDKTKRQLIKLKGTVL